MTDDDPLDLAQVAADHSALEQLRLRSTRPDDSALALLRDLLLDVDAELPAEPLPVALGRGSTVVHLSGEKPSDPRVVRNGAVVALVTAGVLAFGGVAAASTAVAPDGPLAGIGNAVRSAAGAVVSAVKPESPGRPVTPGRSADAPGQVDRTPDDTRAPVPTGPPAGVGRPDGAGRPAEPGRPADPGQPAGAGRPAELPAPVEPGRPAEPAKPAEAGKPAEQPARPDPGPAGTASRGSAPAVDTSARRAAPESDLGEVSPGRAAR